MFADYLICHEETVHVCGQENELKLLNDGYRSEKDELVVLYGRRRIGKSSLVKCFAKKKALYMSSNHKPNKGDGSDLWLGGLCCLS